MRRTWVTRSNVSAQLSVRENVCNISKSVKSRVFLDFEKKTLKTLKRTYSFRGHLIAAVFNKQFPNVSTDKPPTSNLAMQA